MHEGDLAIELCGEQLVLLPERAAYWPAKRTLLVADPHWGKAAAFRAAGLSVPPGTTHDGVARLEAMLARTDAQCITFLGDFLHARSGRSSAVLGALAEWRDRHAHIELVLVRGNHDRHAGDPPIELGVTCVAAPLAVSPFLFVHVPSPSPEGYAIGGHLHPGARLRGTGRQRERLPCFWVGATRAVLPAFGEFTGLADIDAELVDQVYVVARDRVVGVGGG